MANGFIKIATANIRVMGPNHKTDAENQEINDIFWNNTSRLEDIINRELPEGYYCKIDD